MLIVWLASGTNSSDNYKKQLAEQKGFKVLTIWIDRNENIPLENKIKECINFINKN